MSDFLLDPIDITEKNQAEDSFLRNADDDALDPAVLDLLQQWNIGGDGANPFDDALLPEEEALDLMASWEDDADGWNPPDELGHPLYETLFHGEGMEHTDEDPFLFFPTSNNPTLAAAATKAEHSSEHDITSHYYCQPCNDPLATVPWFLNDDDDLADNDSSYDGQLKDLLELQQEDDAFWLPQQPFYNDDDVEPMPLFPSTSLHSLDEEEEKEEDLPLPTSTQEPLDAATLEQALPYVAAFAQSIVPREEASTLSELERAREAFSSRIREALGRPSKFPRAARECYGHSERILGGALSHDGRYLATASQDATVRVWTVATHGLLHTLPSPSGKDYECLRVAWTHTSQWGGPARASHEDRYLLATGGADGNVCVWGCADPGSDARSDGVWTLHTQLDHALLRAPKKPSIPSSANTSSELGTIAEEGAEEHVHEGATDETPQIYSLQFISHWAALSTNADNQGSPLLLTSSDDYVHVWEWIVSEEEEEHSPKKRKGDAPNDDCALVPEGEEDTSMLFQEVLSLHFTCLDHAGYGVRVGAVTSPSDVPNNFGGARNPHNLVYVFDAAYCPANGILGVALSDGTLRLMNGRGVCLSVLQLPPAAERISTHLTSFAWDRTGQRLATTVATGHLVTWNLEMINPLGVVDPPEGANPRHRLLSEGIHTTCCAVMDGGHIFGKPLYGCMFLGADDALLLSYGSDGCICLWDSRRVGEVHAPLAILWDNPYPPPRKGGDVSSGEGYPIYAMAVSSPTKCGTSATIVEGDSATTHLQQCTVIIAGGGTAAGGLLGTPVYLQDVYFLLPDEGEGAVEEEETKYQALLSTTTEPAA